MSHVDAFRDAIAHIDGELLTIFLRRARQQNSRLDEKKMKSLQNRKDALLNRIKIEEALLKNSNNIIN